MPESNAQKKAGFALIAICILGLIGFVAWNFFKETPSEPEIKQRPLVIPKPPAPSPKPTLDQPELETPSEATPEPAATPTAPLPSLNESDAALSSELGEIHPDLLALLVSDELLRKFVRAVNGLSENKLVQTFRPIHSPQGRFAIEELGMDARLNTRLYRIDDANFDRYSIYITALQKLPPEQAVALYQRYYPLMQRAYEELGLREPSFHKVVLRAIANLQEDVDGQHSGATLNQPAVMYEFLDEELENLSTCQKLKIRLGPENSKALEDWLRSAEPAMRSFKAK
jgi:hypothetical protein